MDTPSYPPPMSTMMVALSLLYNNVLVFWKLLAFIGFEMILVGLDVVFVCDPMYERVEAFYPAVIIINHGIYCYNKNILSL